MAFEWPIADCDEVYNYIEPLHYIIHGKGLMTWEYDEKYTLRSWMFIALAWPIKFIPKRFQLPALRMTLGVISSVVYELLALTLPQNVQTIFRICSTFTTGIIAASLSFLPNTLTMFTTAISLCSSRVKWRTQWIAIGAVLGWPFSAVQAIPYVLVQFMLKPVATSCSIFRAAWIPLGILCLMTIVDTVIYGKIVIAPLNIVLYNVFSQPDRGPDIFGVENLYFYAKNLIINMNTLPLFALIGAIVLYGDSRGYNSTLRLTGADFFLAVFSSRPHKEERFLFTIYPSMIVLASFGIEKVSQVFVLIISKLGKTNSSLNKLPKLLILSQVVIISILRSIIQIQGYSAQLNVLKPIQDYDSNATLCMGKAWYLFPSSFTISNNIDVMFVKSGYDGLLPSPFKTMGTSIGLQNDFNKEENDRYVASDHCDFMFDILMPERQNHFLDIDYISQPNKWARVKCLPYLDNESSGFGRLIWLPEWVPRQRKIYGEMCLLKRIY